ncbi:allophanate hydrolase [Thioclava sp. NG1]|uniref:5-oxoprolinase subunit C family protein n=1 Tax=Thioclava sp. NG1 TaxID=2182426 RepID=UPI000D61C7D7|nr:biotin-dependent carboxyltransferase family protein [Thioclava sp. NG1]PWE48382.1 allophanate hydrolase [Thioclava sp. NG1]
MIEVISIPPLATIQDLGRFGYWAQGLGRAGAMDPLAHRVANLLLGNDEEAATLEIPLTPAQFRFVEDSNFALVGAASKATLDGVSLPRVWAGNARAGQVLTLGPLTQGAQVYLSLPGGIDVPRVLGSRSTQLREAFGGIEGRVLEAGDILRPVSASTQMRPLSYSLPPLRPLGGADIVLRVLPSAETEEFSQASRDAFFSQTYTITPASNRQGYRLQGPELTRQATGELRSHGIAPGIVQVPGGGQPIIQLADSATMGGYPKIACVIEPDLWRIGQARAGDNVRFELITLAEARDAEIEETALLENCRRLLDLHEFQKGWS